MKDTEKRLINKIIEELEFNEIKNVAFIVAPLFQSLGKYCDILEDLKNHDEWYVRYNKDETDGYTNGSITIDLYKNKSNLSEDEEDDYDFPECYTYNIEFQYDARPWGFCECSENDLDYDKRYDCCGHGCDWSAPSFSITKTMELGGYSWNGDAHDFWNFEDKFNNIDEVEKKELEKQAEIKRLKKQIECYNYKLNEILNK